MFFSCFSFYFSLNLCRVFPSMTPPESGFFWTMFKVYWALLEIRSIIINVLKLIQRRHKTKYFQIMLKRDPILLIEDILYKGGRISCTDQPWCQLTLGIVSCPQLLNFKATCLHHWYMMSSNIDIGFLFTLESVLLASW